MQNQTTNNWQKVKLGEVAGVLGGFAFKSKWFNRQKKGFPVIKIHNLGEDGIIDLQNVEYVDPSLTNRDLSNFKVMTGDFFVAMTGATAGKVAVLQDARQDIFLNQRVGKFFPKIPLKLDHKFLYYSINTPFNKGALKKLADGSAQGNMSTSQIEEILELYLPNNFNEQNLIASILSTFDEKIKVNNKIAKTLEKMAQTLFKEWFVKFRFPGYEKTEFVNSELGKIPKGWISADFSNIASLGRETINPNLNKTEEFLHYSLPAFDNSQEPVIESGSDIKSNKFLLSDHCVLISKLNPHIPRLWLVDDAHKYRKVSSTEFLVIIPLKEFFLYFIYTFLKSNYFQNTFKTRTTGTSTSHQRVRPHDLLNIPLVLPPDDMIKTFHSTLLSNFILSQKIKQENNRLAALRDLLLPKLMKGEIRV